MAERDKDDIAAALHGLSEGASADSTAEHASDETSHVRETRPAPPSKSSAPKSPARPVAPGAPAPKSSSKPRPAAPSAPPAVPSKRPAAPAARPAGPAPITPARSTSGSSRARPATPTDAEFEGVADDDTGADEEAAEAATQALDYHGPKVAPRRPRRTPYFKKLGFRQTAIPVLLTAGVMMIVAAVVQRVADPESPLARMPAWSGIVMVAAGLILIALGVLNMLAVKSELASKAA